MEGSLPIVEDDQHLYDWGIANRLEQYYHDEQSQQGGGGGEYSPAPDTYHTYPATREFPAPPPAHRAPHYREGAVKDEPGLDMSGWSQAQYRLYRQAGTRQAPGFNIDANEALKVERKRARNRVAASKCRMRKLEKIATLDQEAGKLREENEELAGLTVKLKEEVYRLQQELQWHINNGCQLGGRAMHAGTTQSESQGGLQLAGHVKEDHHHHHHHHLHQRQPPPAVNGGQTGLQEAVTVHHEAVSPDSTTATSSGVLSPASDREDSSS